MRILSLVAKHNTGTKRDATGAFIPEAEAFTDYMNSRGASITAWIAFVDNKENKAKMRNKVIEFIVQHQPDVLAFFCHGWKTGIQFGFDLKNSVEIVNAFPKMNIAPIIIIYGCLTADGGGPGGDGGFADNLRDQFCQAGLRHVQVDAHVTAGHTTRNPNVRRFEGRGSSSGGVGGYYLVEPKSKLWKPWVASLKTPFRFDFPFMSVETIHNTLEK